MPRIILKITLPDGHEIEFDPQVDVWSAMEPFFEDAIQDMEYTKQYISEKGIPWFISSCDVKAQFIPEEGDDPLPAHIPEDEFSINGAWF